MQTLITTTAALALLILAGSAALSHHERHECTKWQDQAATFSDWYATDWQIEQCARYGIDLSAYAQNN